MHKSEWEREEIETLVKIVQAGRVANQSDTESFIEAARVLSRPVEGCRWQWQKWQREDRTNGGRIPESPYPRYDQPLVMTGDALILGDLEAPFQHAEFVNKCLDVAAAWNVRNLILGGDAIHFAALSSFSPEYDEQKNEAIPEAAERQLMEFAEGLPEKYRAKLAAKLADIGRAPEPGVSGELAEIRRVFRALETHFDHIDYDTGNHEKRLVSALEKVLSPIDLMTLLHNGDKWRIGCYYFSFLDSGGVRWRITHPSQAGKGSSKRLAGKFACNTIMLHNHHFSVQTDPTGQYLGIEPGCCVDEKRLPYASIRDNATDTHVVGAVMIVNGKPWLLNDQMTDWDQMKEIYLKPPA